MKLIIRIFIRYGFSYMINEKYIVSGLIASFISICLQRYIPLALHHIFFLFFYIQSLKQTNRDNNVNSLINIDYEKLLSSSSHQKII